jgi:uncharacterized cupin superfamily protein
MISRAILMAGSVFVLAGLSASAQEVSERSASAPEPLSERIGHTDPSKFRHNDRRHEGAAGGMDVMTLVEGRRMQTNLLYMFRGTIPPKGGIGHHYHTKVEEMFLIFDNEAEFTIDGRTSKLAGPVGAPVRYDHSHAIYNSSDRPTQWMNIGVSAVKGLGTGPNIGDDRVGVPLDPKPVFLTMRLDRKLLRPSENLLGGKGVAQYRRALGPEDFFSNWEYVDHLVLPPGATLGRHRHQHMEEIFYVMDGAGSVEVGKESAPIKKGDAIPIMLNETHAMINNGTTDLELMVVGISMQKGRMDTTQER